MSINEKGEIAGFNSGGFVRDPNGTITTFNVPGSSATTAFSINDEGAITGYYFASPGVAHGYVRDPEGNFTATCVP